MGQRDHKTALPNFKEPPKPRPVFLLDTPRPLAVIEGMPCLGGQLELIRGPERIDFGWWDEATMEQPLTRDYYIARKRSGALCWVFNHAGRWYLHGIFS
jgi:protein ImuB